jgi:hypothetical protein
MNNAREIRDLLQQLAGSGSISLFDMEVKSVSESDRTATCSNGVNEIICRLMASVDDGMLCIPKVGSTVVVMLSTTVEPVIIMYSDIEKIVMRGGQYKGLSKVEKLKEKLNNLENKVNELITFSSTHTHAGVTTGAGVTGTPTPPVTGNLTPTTQAEIENENITHG